MNLADLDTNCEVSSNQMFIKNAKTEVDKLRHFGRFNKEEDHGQNAILTKWIITVKDSSTRTSLVA